MELNNIYNYHHQYKEYTISGDARIAILSDLHIPFFDYLSVELSIEYIKNIYKPTHIILNGDTFDGYSISRHEKTHNIPFESEVKATREFFRQLRNEFMDVTILAGSGNHEDKRIENNINANSPQLSAYALDGVHTALGLHEYNIIRLPTNYLVRAGNTGIMHGDIFKGSGGIKPSATIMKFLIPDNNRQRRGMKWWMDSKLNNLIFGHFHRISRSVAIDRLGIMEFHSSGCLTDLRPEYMPMNHWSNGFVTLDIVGSSDKILQYEINNGVKLYEF